MKIPNLSRSKILRALTVILFALFSSSLAWAQLKERQWIAFDPDSKPGDPVQVTTLKSSPQETTFQLKIPGVFLNPVEYGGRSFVRVEIPEGLLDGPGFPQEPGQRGWYDFPEETGHPLLPARAYRDAYSISAPKPVYPLDAMGVRPRTAKEMQELGIDPAGARPEIPTLRGLLAVTHDATPEDLIFEEVESTTQTLNLPAPVAPVGFEGSDQQVEDPIDGYTPPELIDETFYEAFKGAYTGVEQDFSPVSRTGHFSTVEFRSPLMEVRTPTEIAVVAEIVIRVKHLKGIVDFDCPLPWDAWIFKLPFFNGEAMREALTARGIRILASRSAHYLILTPREYRDELDEFARWKQSKGLNVDFAYVGNNVGDDVIAGRAEIDKFIEAYFRENFCHGVYVLLVGDVDVIPSGRSDYIVAPPDQSNGDSDHVYEVLGDDLRPSIYVGRLSVNSADELTTQLTKILDYEGSPVGGDWPLEATLAANSQNDDDSYGVDSSFPSKYAAAVNAIANYGSYSNPPSFEVLHAGAASASATRAKNQDVVDAINGGRGHVLYRGHGGGNSWVSGWDGSSTLGSSFTSFTHIPMLENRAYPIVYSIACQNARLRLDDSISEVWMSDEQGAVAHFGASVNSYTGENHERAKGIFKAIYENGFTRLAPALAEAERISQSVSGGGTSWENNTFCYLLLGDPEMTIRRQPVMSEFAIEPKLDDISGNLSISLSDGNGNPITGGFVNLRLKDGSSLNGFTGQNGELRLTEVQKSQVTEVQIHADGFHSESVRTISGEPIVLRAVGPDESGRFHLKIFSSPGSYTVEASGDLGDSDPWKDIGTVVVEGDQAEFIDGNAVDLPSRFYRVRRD